MGWPEVMDAMQSAWAAAARIDPSRVLWAWQPTTQPPTPYVKLAMPSIEQIGQDFLSMEFVPTRAPGQEFKIQPQGQREIPLEMQVFTDDVALGTSAIFLAEQIKTGLLLPSVRNQLTAVGVSPFDPGRVSYAPSIVGTGFRGRATCTIRCYVPAQALAEYVGYISSMAGTITTTGGASPSLPGLPYTAKVG